ncbi:MAG: peptide chain release factor 3 [OCS116 cluster bacterium]|uniref:Peptide chain release factor 3 n=1 Tax=OCS116 cluster bacterium TaxID=2030921 RepID=A0A2A4Z9E0_9PROT|nr:peptide chain release factor 3 [OCS116 cluster bacterium]
MTLEHEINRRRTFAIISHPDAGKTTLTENLLHMSGAIHLAGQVKARGERRRARSDWMKIEQERGISVTSAAMTFTYKDCIFNLLDTPGHEDFSEDTYRTLTAADAAIMVIDVAKGIEAQTRKLLEVCRLRDIPIITFINKVDREGLDPFGLMDEIADSLALDVTPMSWPVGMGKRLQGIYDLTTDQMTPIDSEDFSFSERVEKSQIESMVEPETWEQAEYEIELIREACKPFDMQSFREGHLTPVFFGSALKQIGVTDLLNALEQFAPAPQPRPTDKRIVVATENKVSGFVFKVQANMDANHRDRVAFVRLVSGKFKRGMKLKLSTGKTISVQNPILFFAQDRELVDEAYGGDIIGIPNHGTIRVGDTLNEGENIKYIGLPNFAPEILERIRPDDPMKAKHLKKALESLSEEGVIQLFAPQIGAHLTVGVVGRLQIEVLAQRIKDEYKIDAKFEASPFSSAKWIECEDEKMLDKFMSDNRLNMANDRDGSPVFLGKSAWEMGYTEDKWPDIKFKAIKERH